MTDRDYIKDRFRIYTLPYNPEDSKIRLKIEHTYRVADLSGRIAASESLSGEDTDLAWAIGMLHDIGRFEQVRRYGTFSDAGSVDHAAFGADLLFKEGLIRDFLPQMADDSLIEQAIRLHNAYQLPEDLPHRQRTFCQILRDADKIDIIRANCEFPRTEIYDFTEEEFLTSDISDMVLDDALSMRNVLRAHRKTAADYIVGLVSLVFGLVYPESRRIIQEQGYLDRIMQPVSDNEDAIRKMEKIRKCVERFLGRTDDDV